MDITSINNLLSRLQTSKLSETQEIFKTLRENLSEKDYVATLISSYDSFKKLQGRVNILFYLTGLTRKYPEIITLATKALSDKSFMVRYRACGVLAYSLNDSVIPALEKLLIHPDDRTSSDARAAIDAIVNKNHHYFHDRNHTGRTFWVVIPEDEDEFKRLHGKK